MDLMFLLNTYEIHNIMHVLLFDSSLYTNLKIVLSYLGCCLILRANFGLIGSPLTNESFPKLPLDRFSIL